LEFSRFGANFDRRFHQVNLDAVIHPLHPRSVFRVSHGDRAEAHNVFVRIEDDGVAGYGEASPNAVYGEFTPDVLEKILGARDCLRGLRIRSIADIERAWIDLWPLLGPSRAAQCAVDLALWDWLGKRMGASVANMALDTTRPEIPSFCTIGLSAPEELEQKVLALRSRPLIKIKSDAAADLSTIDLVRRRTRARLAVDANCAWRNADIAALSTDLARSDVAFIEQPLPPADRDRMPAILAASALPILADESCVVEDDVEGIPGRFSGFNIKLVKCGGLTPGLRMLAHGRQLGLTIMVGCMLESSLLIAAGAVLAMKTDFADLDGAWLLRDDPFAGLPFENGILRPPGTPGLGVEPKNFLW